MTTPEIPPESALSDFLQGAFTHQELSRLAREVDDEMAKDLPDPHHVGLKTYSHQLIESLKQRGHIDNDFFVLLERLRKKRRSELRMLRGRFKLQSSSTVSGARTTALGGRARRLGRVGVGTGLVLVAALGLSYLAIPEVSELPAETPARVDEREVTSSSSTAATAVDVVTVDPSMQVRAKVEALLTAKAGGIKSCVRENDRENGYTRGEYPLNYTVKFTDGAPDFSAKTSSSKSSKTISCIRRQLSDGLGEIARAPGVIELEVTGHYLVR